MNEIETKYFETFKSYLQEDTIFTLFKQNETSKIEKYEFKIDGLGLMNWEDTVNEFLPSFKEFNQSSFKNKYNSYKDFLINQKLYFENEITTLIQPKDVNQDFESAFLMNALIISSGNDLNINIGGYIPDFVIKIHQSKFVIEIDGLKWHEKTQEQAIADRKKDRCYLKNGYTPIRFMAAEVLHNPLDCITETLNICLSDLIDNLEIALSAYGKGE